MQNDIAKFKTTSKVQDKNSNFAPAQTQSLDLALLLLLTAHLPAVRQLPGQQELGCAAPLRLARGCKVSYSGPTPGILDLNLELQEFKLLANGV